MPGSKTPGLGMPVLIRTSKKVPIIAEQKSTPESIHPPGSFYIYILIRIGIRKHLQFFIVRHRVIHIYAVHIARIPCAFSLIHHPVIGIFVWMGQHNMIILYRKGDHALATLRVLGKTGRQRKRLAGGVDSQIGQNRRLFQLYTV